MKDRKFVFLLSFAFVSFIALQIPFHNLVGSSVSFTLFDFLAPISGAFLGSWAGVLSVLGVELVNTVITHAPLALGSIIRIFPTLFAVYYFSAFSKNNDGNGKVILAVPLIAMLLFVINPVGRTVWYYSLFWLIPLVASKFKNNLYVRSLGATFTAHAVGGAAWIWAFNLSAQVWKSLIPVVIEERLLFAGGIALSYIAMKKLVSFLILKNILSRSEVPVASI